MRLRLRGTLFIVVTALLVDAMPAIADIADSAAYPETPAAVVERYLMLDSQGAWFTAAGRADLQKYTSDEIFVATIIAPTLITNYKVVKSSSTDDQVSVQVEYRVIGYSEDLAFFQPKNEVVRNTINVKRVNGRWTIKTQIFPHINWRSVVKQIQTAKQKSLDRLAAIHDDEKRRKIETRIKYENLQRDDMIKRINQHVQNVERKNSSGSSNKENPFVYEYVVRH